MNRIEVDLKPGSYGNKELLATGPKLTALLQGEYAIRFLESIGVPPSRESVEFVLRYFPLEENCVFPVWVREKVIIAPGMKIKNTSGDPAVVLNELFRREKQEREQQRMRHEGHTHGSTAAGGGGRGAMARSSSSRPGSRRAPTSTSASVRPPGSSHGTQPASPPPAAGIGAGTATATAADGDGDDNDVTLPELDPAATMVELLAYFKEVCDRDVGAMTLVLTRGAMNELLTPPTMKEQDDIQAAVDQFCDNLPDYVPSVARDYTGKVSV